MNTNEEVQTSQLSSMARELESMRASQKKLNTELIELRKTKEEQDGELSRSTKAVQDQMRRLDTQEPSIGRFKEEGRRARAEVSRELTGDKDLAFELETMVMNLKHVSETGVIDSVGGESLRAMFGGREAVAEIPREEAWRTIGSSLADDGSIAGGVLTEPLDLRRRAFQTLWFRASQHIRGPSPSSDDQSLKSLDDGRHHSRLKIR